MSTKLIDVSKLNEALVIYDKALRTLPFASIEQVAKTLGLNVMELAGKHALINERRRAGGTQSYKVGKDFKALTNLLGYDPSVIEPLDVVFITKENSKKYTDNELLIVGGVPVDNKTKKHPLETKVAFSLVRSHVEDIVYSLFSAERDDDSTAPSGAFNGAYTKVDKLITAGDINAARGNLQISGDFIEPTDGASTAAYDNLVDWIGNTHNALRSSQGGIPQLLVAQTVLKAARTALRNKLKQQEYPSIQRMLELLREDAFCPGLILSTHECLGTGSRLILQKVGNIDLAINTKSAEKFVQIRNIYEDPNDWQFWLQAGYDTRIRDWHEKVFCTNEQKNASLDLSGDYCATGAVQVNITGASGAKWSLDDSANMRNSGEFLLNVSPGSHTVKFGTVADKTAPEDLSVVVKAGEVTSVTGTYTA